MDPIPILSSLHVEQWRPLNDQVMGGVSLSSVHSSDTALMHFSGVVSPENGGGFSSIRGPGRSDFTLSKEGGFVLVVRGDRKRFSFRIVPRDPSVDYIYNFSFYGGGNEATQYRARSIDFVAKCRGRKVSAPPLWESRIGEYGFLIGEKQYGPFALDILSLSYFPSSPD